MTINSCGARLIKIIANYNTLLPLLVILFFILFTNCNNETNKVNVDNINLKIKINRFDVDLASLDLQNIDSSTRQLQNKYLEFFPLFIENILRLGKMEDNFYQPQLMGFIKFDGTQEIIKQCNVQYADISDIEKDITLAFKYYKYYFPENNVPEVISFFSEYIFANVTADSILAIGLDLYLGENYPYYPALNIPKYKYSKYTREYVVPNAIKAFAHSQFDESQMTSKNLLSYMIYHGKILYFMDLLLPQVPDSIKIGYTAQQLEWCKKSEANIWAFFIDKKLLFNTDYKEFHKYLSEGPFTTGLPRESAPMLGIWIGWKIVREYMKKNFVSSLPELMSDPDKTGQSILNKSKYKPKK